MTAATELDVGLPSPSRRRSFLRYWRGNLKGSEFTWALAFSVPYIAVFVGFVAYPVFYGVWMGSDPALYAVVEQRLRDFVFPFCDAQFSGFSVISVAPGWVRGEKHFVD